MPPSGFAFRPVRRHRVGRRGRPGLRLAVATVTASDGEVSPKTWSSARQTGVQPSSSARAFPSHCRRMPGSFSHYRRRSQSPIARSSCLSAPVSGGSCGTHRFRTCSTAGGFADGLRIAAVGGVSEEKARLYVWRMDNALPPTPISPEGVRGTPIVAPDGQWVAIQRDAVPLSLYAVNGGASRSLSGGLSDDRPLKWSADGRSLFVRRGSDVPARIERLEVTTGKRSLWRELRPADMAGVFGITSVVLTPDGGSYGYTVASSLGSLYLAQGLK
jgi:hypothetical protein